MSQHISAGLSHDTGQRHLRQISRMRAWTSRTVHGAGWWCARAAILLSRLERQPLCLKARYLMEMILLSAALFGSSMA